MNQKEEKVSNDTRVEEEDIIELRWNKKGERKIQVNNYYRKDLQVLKK